MIENHLKHMYGSVAANLANLMYSFRYKLKNQYYMALDKLKPVMSETLYNFYRILGDESDWKKGS